MKAGKYYAYLIPETGKKGVADTWQECERIVKGKPNARYRGFKTEEEAWQWLDAGASYTAKIQKKLERGIYFDAGTGRGDGVEISVTDEKGKDLLASVLKKGQINRFGKHLVRGKVTNNFGELLACKYALEIAIKTKAKKIFGDSKLVVEYWSRGFSKEELPVRTQKLIDEVHVLRKKFEKQGGKVKRVSGDDNPADLGFH